MWLLVPFLLYLRPISQLTEVLRIFFSRLVAKATARLRSPVKSFFRGRYIFLINRRF